MKTLIHQVCAWLVVCFCALPAFGAIQPAWIARYSSGLTRSTNQPVAMALDRDGNVIVTASSTTARGDFDYVTIKYTAKGTQLWLARYGSLGSGHDQPRALAVDPEGNVYVTGSSSTIKYGVEGIQQWGALYGGRGLTVDTGGHVYVTGYSTEDFATVKLSPTGSNVWVRTHDEVGQGDISDAVEVDAEGSVYVAGRESVRADFPYYSRLALIKYLADGTPQWTNHLTPNFVRAYAISGPSVKRLQVGNDGTLYLLANLFGSGGIGFYAAKLQAGTGQLEWSRAVAYATDEGATAATVDPSGDCYLTGRRVRTAFVLVGYATFKVDTSGTTRWEASYVGSDPGYHIANAIGLDASGGVYVTGQSVNSSGDDDWATIKYNSDGKEQWVRRQDGPMHAHDEANAIAVDPSGVYVAGSQTTSNSVVELVLIKYAELENIRLAPDDRVMLQFFATPGQVCRFQATTNFPSWVELGSSLADANGIARFEDTNAPAYPHRFYRFVSP